LAELPKLQNGYVNVVLIQHSIAGNLGCTLSETWEYVRRAVGLGMGTILLGEKPPEGLTIQAIDWSLQPAPECKLDLNKIRLQMHLDPYLPQHPAILAELKEADKLIVANWKPKFQPLPKIPKDLHFPFLESKTTLELEEQKFPTLHYFNPKNLSALFKERPVKV
jgi:hypothetical protein